MSKIKLALQIVEDLKELAGSIEALALAMKAADVKEGTSCKETAQSEEAGNISIEQLRSVLAEKTRAGKLEEIKGLIGRYGGVKLTDVDTEKYVDILREAEEL